VHTISRQTEDAARGEIASLHGVTGVANEIRVGEPR
jgi:hypothetical protein